MLRFSEVYSAQDNGVHQNDGFSIDLEENLLVVCDGVSSHNGNGQRAADLFVEKYKGNHDIRNTLSELIDEDTHKTTIVIAHTRGEILEICSIGDSRVYIIRKNEIEQLTRDQNLFGAIVDKLPWGGRTLDPEEMKTIFLQGIPKKLEEEIAEQLFGDKTANIFHPRRMKKLLENFKRPELYEICKKEFETRGCSETFLAEVVRIAPSYLIHHLAKRESKAVIRVGKYEVEAKDEILLTTDGLHGSFPNKGAILNALQKAPHSAQKKAEGLLASAKKSPDRKRDDMTLIYARIGRT